jgi:hypothetical protein
MFMHSRNETEIQQELKRNNIPISVRGVGQLARKFIIYLAIIHREAKDQIKLLLQSKGGYILHLDGTCEDDSPHLICALDSISEIVLGSVKLPSESAKEIVPLLKRMKTDYGEPIALVHDMGQGIAGAVAEVFPNAPDFICHFHFLRDVGVDLLATENTNLRKALHDYRAELGQLGKELKRTIEIDPLLAKEFDLCKFDPKSMFTLPHDTRVFIYTLLLWIQDANSELDGYGFPFDQAHLATYRRLLAVHTSLEQYHLAQPCPQFFRMVKILQRLAADRQLVQVVSTMEERISVFEALRSAMRIAKPKGIHGLNCTGADINIKTIRDAVVTFRADTWLNQAAEETLVYKKLLQQIDRYWTKLFADPITVETPGGQIKIQPQRTNNILEQFFRRLKKHHRRKGGMQSMTKFLKSAIAESPLVANLKNPQYLTAVLAGKSLLDRFAEVDSSLIRKELKMKDRHRLPLRLRKVLRRKDFLLSIINSSHPKPDSNRILPS